MRRGSFILLALLATLSCGRVSGSKVFPKSDALDRRLSTTTVLVSNGVPSTVPPQVVISYFDPQVAFLELGAQLITAPEKEFLEAGTSPNVETTWKLYGPDLNGRYGGLNGIGGLEGVSPYQNSFNPVISDARGNVLAQVTNGVVSWTTARPTGYGAVPGFRPVAYGNGVDLAQSCVFLGREVDVTGYHHFGLRDYDPVSGQWLSYDPFWNPGDPNGQSFCGGDPIDHNDSDGRLSAQNYNSNPGQDLGADNGAQNQYLTVAPIMESYTETTTHLTDGTGVITGVPGEAPSLLDPNQINYWTENSVTAPTGQLGLFVTPTPLPSDYGSYSSTPIPIATIEQEQQNTLAIEGLALGITVIGSDGLTGELAAETTAGQTYQIMDGVRRATAANLTGATTINAEILDANMVSQGVQQVPINSLLSPKEFIDLSGSGAYRWNRVLEGTQNGANLPPIQITPGSSGIPIQNVTIGHP